MKDVLTPLIDQIPVPSFIALAYRIVEYSPGSFWVVPASSSGKYHPPDECCEGGTVLHTARVMKLCFDLAEMSNLSEGDTSKLVVAALMHDMFKGGEGNEPMDRTWPLHQLAWWAHIHKVCYNTELARNLCEIVEAHEGRWAVRANDGRFDNPLAGLLHTADYIASRSHVLVQTG